MDDRDRNTGHWTPPTGRGHRGPHGGGSRTFLFTDIEGSSRRWEQRLRAMDSALALHDEIAAHAVATHNGRIFEHTGDGIAAVFDRALDAVLAAVDLQRNLGDRDFDAVGGLRVRMGIHAGESVERDGSWFGPTVNRCARLTGIAAGGQVLVSGEVARQVGREPAGGIHLRDLGEHVLRDLSGTERVYQVDAVGLPGAFPPLTSVATYRTNLRPQLTSFVGREQERQHLRQLLGRSSLVTVTGVGGGGKTRLALQTAGELLDEYPDGVFVVELAPLTDPLAVARTVATTVGCFDPLVETVADDREQAAEATLEHLARQLAPRSMLTVLDNCEHLLAPVRRLVDVLRRTCPDLTILATSREPLAVSGEQRYEIPPLRGGSVTAGRAEPVDGSRTRGDAVQLFRDRAVAVRPDFELTDANAAAVSEICRRLDGIPLAVELAAAKVSTLTPGQIAARLDDALTILRGSTGQGPRHATLESALAWSYDQLGPRERRVLCRLAVFRGGCTLEAAEAVAGRPPLDPAEVLTALEELITKSLVRVDTSGEHGRYHLLEPVRQFAEARLGTWGDGDEVREAHAGWMVDRFSDARMFANVTDELITELLVEEDNHRAALEWARSRDDELTVRLVLYAFWYWRARAEHATATAWAREAIDRLGTDPSPHLATALGMLAGVMETMGETARSLELFERSLDINEQLAYPRGTGWSAAMLGRIHGLLGHRDEADRMFRYADEQLRIAEDRVGLAWCAVNDAWLSLWHGNPARARRRVDQVAAADAAPADPAGMAEIVRGLLELLDGHPETGARHLESGLSMIVSTTDRAYTLPFIARYELATPARRMAGIVRLSEGLDLLRQTGQIANLQFALEAAACVDADDAETAARLLGAADQLYERTLVARPGPSGAFFETARRAVQQELGGDQYRTYHEAGLRLAVGDAVDLALDRCATAALSPQT